MRRIVVVDEYVIGRAPGVVGDAVRPVGSIAPIPGAPQPVVVDRGAGSAPGRRSSRDSAGRTRPGTPRRAQEGKEGGPSSQGWDVPAGDGRQPDLSVGEQKPRHLEALQPIPLVPETEDQTHYVVESSLIRDGCGRRSAGWFLLSERREQARPCHRQEAEEQL